MAKSARASTLRPAGVLDWSGVRTQRVDYEPGAMIFSQGDPATNVMYLEKGVGGYQSCRTRGPMQKAIGATTRP